MLVSFYRKKPGLARSRCIFPLSFAVNAGEGRDFFLPDEICDTLDEIGREGHFSANIGNAGHAGMVSQWPAISTCRERRCGIENPGAAQRL
jgi:hypothetical protein